MNAGARFLSSAGVAVLLLAHHASDVALRVVASARVLLRPLELTRLTNDLDIQPTLQSALDR
jgi:hypothetical protein